MLSIVDLETLFPAPSFVGVDFPVKWFTGISFDQLLQHAKGHLLIRLLIAARDSPFKKGTPHLDSACVSSL